MMEYRQATPHELNALWDRNIAVHPGESCWIRWKKEYLDYNRSEKAKTFAVICNGDPVGEGTLILSPECKAVAGRSVLCDGKETANINALRIRKEYENQGHISKMIRVMESYAVQNGITKLTIGVEADQTRNLAIYLHWGFTEFLMSEGDGHALVLYFGKPLNE
ncbi:MAG: GNAT family N-acetyltransferase [Eubacteriales bacterium]